MSEMNENEKVERGGISVETDHIFPIIKKWLYSDKDIFLREIVSNACDACTKLRRLSSLGEVHDIEDSYRIDVSFNKTDKTITVKDNGIGMTGEELKKYICQIALSGALEFIEKYEGEGESGAGIIGHFGLGFYSSFMVSESVEVITKSYTGEVGHRLICREEGDYELSEYDTEERGTSVIMHVSEAETEYLSESKLSEMLRRYCSFMPVEIFFRDEEKEEDEDKDKDKHEHKHNHDHEDGCECEECECEHGEKPINDTKPLWLRPASECTADDYKKFYGQVFSDFKEPLFHIHLNADYPLNFKGILYFPKIAYEYESMEGEVKLYYNQVFVADNIKEVIPEYLIMLKGVLDCPELPLNVSRSYLQTNSYVSKLSAHIVKKVADKINSMYNTEREYYEKIWKDLKVFVEYASMRDRKFYDRVKGSVLYPLCGGGFTNLDDYLEGAKEKHENTVYYATDSTVQSQYISMLEDQGIKVILLDKVIDTQFISIVEGDRAGVKFMRVDADLASALKGDGQQLENETLAGIFKKISGNDKLEVKFESLKDLSVPAVMMISEQSRRMEDMMKMYSMAGEEAPAMFPVDTTLILNSANSLIQRLCDDPESERSGRIAAQIYSLSLLSQRQLNAEEMKKFLSDSFAILSEF